MCPTNGIPVACQDDAKPCATARHIDPTTCNAREVYHLLTSGVVPRPIAWISTMNAQGMSNLAPFSFFTVVSIDPPIFAVTQVYPGPQRENKDTVANLLETNECIVNIVSDADAAIMNATCADYPRGVSEMDALGIETVPGTAVSVPGVKSSAIRFECTLRETLDIGNGRVVLLNVVHVVVAKRVLHADGVTIDDSLLHVVGRMGADVYTRTESQLEMKRPVL
ncbi:Aste57867_6953 [Aphanomyces stellatus]|uniref:Aste57867_6953 protein n=1 Tax=Aphanomyces stellatus TaxID=120398 RepID=A0A485KG92_9STRA|nr:hypothetical protein As57867_006931 [Aphanomyces stellatus]VFT83905.1 Aste57867_6953 [Aphanomyces stellatus]